MVPQQSSFTQSENKKLPFQTRIFNLRQQNDNLRKSISTLISQTFTAIGSFPQTSFIKNQKQFTQLLNPQNSQNLIGLLNELSSVINFRLSEKRDSQQTTKDYENMKQRQRKLQQENDVINVKELSVLGMYDNVEEKRRQLHQIETEFVRLLEEYNRLQKELQQTQAENNTYEKSQRLRQIEENWDQQVDFIYETVRERAQKRQLNRKLQTLLKMCNEKLQEIKVSVHDFLEKKKRNQTLKTANDILSEQVDNQIDRKQRLENSKIERIHQRQMDESVFVVEKWDQQKKASENVLLSIIQKINKKLPSTKLQDINQIIKAAQKFFKKQAR